MSDLLRIGAQGVAAYRGALRVVGDNVANAQTEGYSRRGISLRDTGILGVGQPYQNDRYTVGGVHITAIERNWDAFRAADVRLAAADAGQSDARLRWLQVTESALSNDPSGIGARLTVFYNSADALAADPRGAAPRRAMLMALEDVASAFRTSAEALARASDGVKTEAEITTTAINNELKALADVNEAISRARQGGGPRAALEDERDRLLDSLSSKIQIEVTLDERGQATVRAAGTSGPNLVDQRAAGEITMQVAADGRISLSVSAEGTIQPLPVMGGALAGLVDASNQLASRRQTLDTIATDFVAQLNTWSAAGLDKAGNPGAPILAGTGAANLTVVLTDPDGIPAAAPGGAENGNLLLLQGQRGDGGPEARIAAMINILAQATASARTQDGALATRHDNALAERDQISGVDLDREAAELIRFQQAYDASAKIIQVARETLNSILAIF